MNTTGLSTHTHPRSWRMLRGRHAGRTNSFRDRTGDYEIMLLTMDIIVIDQIQTYAKRLKAYCEEHGLYRQEVKKNVNTICSIIDRLYKLVMEADDIKFAPLWRHAYPHFVDDYLAEGGGLVAKLQVAYRDRWNDEVQKLYWAERQVTSYNHAEQGELLSMAYVIMMVSQIAEQVTERIVEEMFTIQYGFFMKQKMLVPLKLHKELQRCCKNISAKFKIKGTFRCTDHLEHQLESILERITTHLVGMDNLRLTTDTMAEAMREYVDYALARIRMMQVTGTYDDSAMDHLVAVCGANLTSKLLSELSEVAVEDDADTFDVMANMLPLSDSPTALNRARKLFFDKMFID